MTLLQTLIVQNIFLLQHNYLLEKATHLLKSSSNSSHFVMKLILGYLVPGFPGEKNHTGLK